MCTHSTTNSASRLRRSIKGLSTDQIELRAARLIPIITQQLFDRKRNHGNIIHEIVLEHTDEDQTLVGEFDFEYYADACNELARLLKDDDKNFDNSPIVFLSKFSRDRILQWLLNWSYIFDTLSDFFPHDKTRDLKALWSTQTLTEEYLLELEHKYIYPDSEQAIN